ncbi:MAG: hypothetical protein U0P47_03105 [Acidimicrobiales bacterium]
MNGLRRTASIVAAVVAVGLLAVGWIGAVSDTEPAETAQIAVVLTLVVLGAQGAGLRITWLRPAAWTGVLVQLVALETLLGAARQADVDSVLAFVVGWLVLSPVPALLVWNRANGLRAGRPDAVERVLGWLTAAAVLVCVGLAVPVVVAAHGRDRASPMWWNVAVGSRASRPAAVLMLVYVIASAVGIVAAVAALVRRHRAAAPADRSATRAVVVTALCWSAAALAVRALTVADPAPFLGPFRDFTPSTSLVMTVLPLVSAIAFVVAVVWFELVVPRLHRRDHGVVLGARRDVDPDELVRHALSDPSARALFAAEDGAGWVGADGRPVPVDPADPDRVLTVFRRSGVVVGAIEHDAQLAAHPDAVELVGTMAGLVLEREGLMARTRAGVAATRRLTARLVDAADEPRHELADALRAGPVGELRAIAARLAGGADLDGADLDALASELRAVAGEVRRLSHGLLPPSLADTGLRAALPRAAVDCGRLAPSVEVTAYLAARTDPAAVLTRDDGVLRIELSAPPSVPSLLDRVEVLGGRVEGRRIVLPVEG